MSAWSELEFQAVNRFIHQQVRQYGHHMDEEECCAEAWRALLEARYSYHLVEGCCDFRAYAEHCVAEGLDLLRRQRDPRFKLESRLSLDMRYDGARESLGERYFRKTSDCSGIVALRDFMERQGKEKCRVLWHLYYQEDDLVIMEEERLTPERYYGMLEELQEAFREWQAI